MQLQLSSLLFYSFFHLLSFFSTLYVMASTSPSSNDAIYHPTPFNVHLKHLPVKHDDFKTGDQLWLVRVPKTVCRALSYTPSPFKSSATATTTTTTTTTSTLNSTSSWPNCLLTFDRRLLDQAIRPTRRTY